jgi:AraC-like DNA-binding protein
MLPGHRAQAWLHRPAFRRPRHFHAEPELNFVFDGHARMGVGDFVFDMSAGDVLLLRPGQDHEMLVASDDLELVVVAVTPELAARCLRGPLPAASRPFQLPARELGLLREQLLSLDAPTTADNHERIVGEVFARSEQHVGRGHPLVRRALSAVSQHLDLASAEMARQLRVQPSELSRYFHRDVGLRMVDYRTRHRLMRFIQLVDAGMPLTRAALEAPFGSYAQCHRAFQQYLGCPPRAYFNAERQHIDNRLVPLTHHG